MCGITGAVWQREQEALLPEHLERMTQALNHRGPDGSGSYWKSWGQTGVALGHRRLSIIDPALGQQPMTNEDGSIHVVFNGEIYNYRELREQLLRNGHRFTTECDTEVLVHLYEERGPDLVNQLRGMFAFAIWDESNRQLLLARDRLGQKPLVYRHDPHRLLFASEIKSLLQLPQLPRHINPQALDAYLALQYVPQPDCMHPRAEESAVAVPETIDQASEQLKTTLTEAVRLRLRSDVPLGAFLSGGIDSTLITGLMQQEVSQPVQTFSIGFAQAEYDETSYARMAAQHLGTEHHEQIVSPSAVESLPKLIWHYDEPFADSSAIPTMALCEMTSQAVKVALTGDGGDELFVGYDRYRAVQLADKLDRGPAFLKTLLGASFWNRLPTSIGQKTLLRRIKRFQASLQLSPRLRYLQWISQFQLQERQSLYTEEFKSQINTESVNLWFDSLYEQLPPQDQVSWTAAVDQISYLPGDILTKVDIASMAYGLECRSPFLDHHVAGFAARLPLRWKLKGKAGKWILRKAFGSLLPEPILKRKKMGFGVPVDHWFRNELQPLLHDYLLSEQALGRGYFRQQALEQLIHEHTHSQRDHAYRLWSLLVLESWHRLYIDQPVTLTAPGTIS